MAKRRRRAEEPGRANPIAAKPPPDLTQLRGPVCPHLFSTKFLASGTRRGTGSEVERARVESAAGLGCWGIRQLSRRDSSLGRGPTGDPTTS